MTPAEKMKQWRAANPKLARKHYRARYWRKKGYPNYAGVALGGKSVNSEIRTHYLGLMARVHTWAHEYYVWNAPTVSDAEYDRAFDDLKRIEQEYPDLADPNSPTKRVGGIVLDSFPKGRHTVPMQSLEKTTTAEGVVKFLGERPGVCEPKIDGASLAVHYVHGRLVLALTRGDGRIGDDVTQNARTIRNLPLVLKEPVTLEVRGEVYMRYSAFAKRNEMLEKEGLPIAANPRNAAAGALKLKSSAACAKVPLSFMACRTVTKLEGCGTHSAVLERLEDLGFATSSSLPLPIKDCAYMYQTDLNLGSVHDVQEVVENLKVSRGLQDFPTDGLVFKVDSLEAQEEMGEGTTFPKWAIAYKYPPEQALTRITRVEFTVGKTGKITPVATFTPVYFSGSTVEKASLCNRDELARLGVRLNDAVWIEKSNEIIPKVVRVESHMGGAPIQMPDKCPVCGETLHVYEGIVDVFCTNRKCLGQAEARLRFATGKQALDIDGCGAQTVKQLVAHGIYTLSDLLSAEDLGFLSHATLKKVKKGIEASIDAPFYRKLMALNIEGFGVETCQIVAAALTSFAGLWEVTEAVLNGREDKLKDLDGVGEVRSKAWHAYCVDWNEELARLDELGFWEQAVSSDELPAVKGKSFCITGALPGCSRDQAHEEILRRGGTFKTSVSRKLDFLVIGTGGGQKASLATKYNVTCMQPEQFFSMLEWHPTQNLDPDREY